VSGRLRQRSYETKEGEKRTVYEIEADEVGPSLKNASAKVTKAARTGASSGSGSGGRQDQGRADPWVSDKGSGYSDEPPF
jgi:single-strand DNA-binding protein